MIKKLYFLSVFLIVFSLTGIIGFSQENTGTPEDLLPGFQLILSGDLGYAKNSDVKKFAESHGQDAADEYNAYAAAHSVVGGFEVDKTTNPDINYGVDIELRFSSGNFGLGIGAGYHSAQSVSKVSSPNWANKIEYTASLDVIPLVATLYYRDVINEFSFLSFGAGAGYYIGMFDGEMTSNETIPMDVDVYEPLSDSSTIGYHIKAEYSYLYRPFCVTAGIMGRYVQFDEFKDEHMKIKMDAGLTGISIYLAAGLAI